MLKTAFRQSTQLTVLDELNYTGYGQFIQQDSASGNCCV